MLKLILSLFFITSIIFISLTNRVYAATCDITLSKATFDPKQKYDVTITSDGECFKTDIQYTIIAFPNSNPSLNSGYSVYRIKPTKPNQIPAKIDLFSGDIATNNPGDWTLWVCAVTSVSECKNNRDKGALVSFGKFKVNQFVAPSPQVNPNTPVILLENQKLCTYQISEEVQIVVNNIKPLRDYRWWWVGNLTYSGHFNSGPSADKYTVLIPKDETKVVGDRTFCVGLATTSNREKNCIILTFLGAPPTGNRDCKKQADGSISSRVAQPTIKATGEFCDESKGTIKTAIGCISTDPVGLVKDFFKLAVGIGGGIALLLMIAGAFQMIASAGNPESIKEGKERFTNAIIGLLFVVFSILLLRIIGVDILGLGQFLGVTQ